jgi:5'-3' exonuclease
MTPLNHSLLSTLYKTAKTNMGIRGLTTFLKWKVPGARRPWTPGPRDAQRWGIDCSCLMYRARGSALSIVTVMAGLIVRLRSAGIEPIVVFDGKPPAAKADVIAARRTIREAATKEITSLREEITITTNEVDRATLEKKAMDIQQKAPQISRDDKDELKNLLYASGVLFITATGEADDVLAYLCHHNTIQAVVSTDMDMLARGVPLLVVPETADATVLTEIALVNVLSSLRLTYEQFVDACTLMGSDYTGAAWEGMKPVDAVKAAALNGLKDVSGLEEAARMLRSEGILWDDIVSEKQREKWDSGPSAKEPIVLTTIASSNGWPLEWISVLG